MVSAAVVEIDERRTVRLRRDLGSGQGDGQRSLEGGETGGELRTPLRPEGRQALGELARDGKADRRVEHHCSASIGGVVFLNHEAPIGDILQKADAAMYQAKESGRNTVRFW